MIVFKSMVVRLTVGIGCAFAGMLSLVVTGCGKQAPVVPETAPFHYHGQTLFFSKGTVEVREEEGPKTEAYARLVPDKPKSGYSIDARYNIDLGRGFTGRSMGGGYWLGYHQYPPDSLKTDLGDDYIMFCPPPTRHQPAFDCAALLKSMPLAAIQFNSVPSSPEAARSMVAEAESYLTRAKARGASR